MLSTLSLTLSYQVGVPSGRAAIATRSAGGPAMMARTPLMAGNWKMNTDLDEAVALAKAVSAEADKASGVDVAVCVPSPFLIPVKEALAGGKVGLGAQDCHWEDAGAFTGERAALAASRRSAAPPPPPAALGRGELVGRSTGSDGGRSLAGAISTSMIKSVGSDYVLAGHSERRAVFGDSDADVNKKVLKILAGGLKAILCIGELKEERESGETFNVCATQLSEGLAGVDAAMMKDIVIA